MKDGRILGACTGKPYGRCMRLRRGLSASLRTSLCPRTPLYVGLQELRIESFFPQMKPGASW